MKKLFFTGLLISIAFILWADIGSHYPNTNKIYPNWMISLIDPSKTNLTISGSNLVSALYQLGLSTNSGNGFPLTAPVSGAGWPITGLGGLSVTGNATFGSFPGGAVNIGGPDAHLYVPGNATFMTDLTFFNLPSAVGYGIAVASDLPNSILALDGAPLLQNYVQETGGVFTDPVAFPNGANVMQFGRFGQVVLNNPFGNGFYGGNQYTFEQPQLIFQAEIATNNVSGQAWGPTNYWGFLQNSNELKIGLMSNVKRLDNGANATTYITGMVAAAIGISNDNTLRLNAPVLIGGGSGVHGGGVSYTNLANGSWFQLTTNGHFRFFDQYGTMLAKGSNYFDITQTNGYGLHETNGVVYMQGFGLPPANYAGKLAYLDANGLSAGLTIGNGLSTDGLNLNANSGGIDLLFKFMVPTNGSEVAVYTNAIGTNSSLDLDVTTILGGPTNYLSRYDKHLFWRSLSAAPLHVGSNVIVRTASATPPTARWDTNAAGQAVLFVQGVANESMGGTVKGFVTVKTNGLPWGGGGGGGGNFYPTNLPGAPAALAWWNADLSQFSQTPSYWTDLGPNAYGMTNAGASFHPTRNLSAIGTNSAIGLYQHQWTNLQFTLNQPFTVCATMCVSNAFATGLLYGGTNVNTGTTISFGQIGLQSGGTLTAFGAMVTNRFATYVVSFNGLNTTLWTNGVLAQIHNVGSAAWVGLQHGSGAQLLYDMCILNGSGTTSIASNYNYSVTNTLGVPLVQP